jgi:hypothetical protein
MSRTLKEWQIGSSYDLSRAIDAAIAMTGDMNLPFVLNTLQGASFCIARKLTLREHSITYELGTDTTQTLELS